MSVVKPMSSIARNLGMRVAVASCEMRCQACPAGAAGCSIGRRHSSYNSFPELHTTNVAGDVATRRGARLAARIIAARY